MIKIIDSRDQGDSGELILEPTAGKLQEMLPEIHTASLQIRMSLCLQLLTGVKVMHSAGICHLSISPGNVFCVRTSHPPFLLKLGLTGRSSDPAFAPPGDASLPPHRIVAQQPARDMFGSACVLSMLISGHHIFGMDHDEQLQNIATGSMVNAPLLECVSLEAHDLVQGMLLKQPSIDECLAHPLFWKAKDRFLYISELVRTDKHMRLPTGETLGIGTDWRTQLRSGLLFEHTRAGSTGSGNRTGKDWARYGSQPRELLRMLRNFYQHPPSLEGANPLTEASKELKRFPALLTSLYSIFGALDEL